MLFDFSSSIIGSNLKTKFPGKVSGPHRFCWRVGLPWGLPKNHPLAVSPTASTRLLGKKNLNTHIACGLYCLYPTICIIHEYNVMLIFLKIKSMFRACGHVTSSLKNIPPRKKSSLKYSYKCV